MTVDRGAVIRRLDLLSGQARLAGGLMKWGRASSGAIEAAALVASCLGSDHYLVKKLDEWSPVPVAGYGYSSPEDRFCGLVDAAIALIAASKPATVDIRPSVDPNLWSNVQGLVDGELWEKVPSAVATFVEDWFRRLAGNPPNKKGGKSYGYGLFAEVLRPGGPFALGSEPSEQEGWRDLGQGLAKAIGNGHRHTLQNRADAERLAWGVIGLGSLLIGEARRTYGEPGGELSKSR